VSAVDFAEWAAPDLVFKNLGADSRGLGGHTFTVCPPTVDDMSKVLALAVRGEVRLGIAPEGTEIPEPILEVLDSIGPTDHPALGATFYEMKDKGINAPTIDRAAYYAVFYWARGKRYADALALLLWAHAAAEAGTPAGGASAPKG
jgi:hypothetical protein